MTNKLITNKDGHPTTAEEAMDDATPEDGFSDESAYTSPDSKADVERTHEDDQAT